jgi:Putative transposase
MDPLAEESPILAGLTAASVRRMVATGDRAGFHVRRVLSDPEDAIRTGPLCFASRGFSLHAATRIAAGDKTGLEILCRYVTRPPLAAGRLSRVSDDLLSFKLKTPWSDGTTHLLLSPMELIEKIAALVPPPRVNLIRYHGVLAPHAKHRDKIVPTPQITDSASSASYKHRLSFAALLARVFQIQIETCPNCGGRMRIVAALTEPSSIRRYLEGVGLSADIPNPTPARAPPQQEFDFDF